MEWTKPDFYRVLPFSKRTRRIVRELMILLACQENISSIQNSILGPILDKSERYQKIYARRTKGVCKTVGDVYNIDQKIGGIS